MSHDDPLLDLLERSRWQREAYERAREKAAQEQHGECFDE